MKIRLDLRRFLKDSTTWKLRTWEARREGTALAEEVSKEATTLKLESAQ